MNQQKKSKKIGDYKFTYWPGNKVGYLQIKKHDGKSPLTTLVLVEGKLFMDRDKKGNIIGIEYLG